MSAELAPRYDPKAVEQELYQRWESSGVFTADPSSEKPPYVIVIPPPNVTGVLHMGHALNNTIQDVMIRLQRKRGFEALWLPGTDHAGIATQARVEKKLFQEQGKKRTDLGREKFLAEVWAWKEEHGNIILEQLRRMGCSLDWTRTKFTMDEDLSRAVREAFVRLFDKGLVYRGARLVNWDCVLKTAVSDDEIEHVERDTHLWHLRYPVAGDANRHLVVATTRPETMLGDTGVAVHPDDPRYGDLVGKTLTLPLVGREIPVVADDGVDPEFGTGAVKVTPGHDPADYERGQRHGLPIVNVLAPDGSINENGGEFQGLPREQARKKVVAALDAQGLLEKTEAYRHKVAVSDRSKSIIEPLVSEQWFVSMRPLAEPAIAAVKDGSLQFVPERWSKVYLQWLENVRDWCISRQLWWGHRIPVWYDEDEVPVASRTDLEIGSAHPKTGKPIVRQDDDVMDTWASSWLWPLATLGWPERTVDLERFYPTQFLGTARDILYLWVARMVMAGYEFADHLPHEKRCPFSVCYINATVLDDQGRRMSKSLDNGIDPLELIEEFGADAMRLSLTLLTVEGQDIRFSKQRVEEGRNFVNKLWNAARFVLSRVPEGALGDVDLSAARTLEDRWILHRLAELVDQVGSGLEGCRFHESAQNLRRFVWNEFCDWYLEIAKVRFDAEDEETRRMAQAITATVIVRVLELLHPITPFVTEAIHDHVRTKHWFDDPGSLVTSTWPTSEGIPRDETADRTMQALQAVVGAVRNLRAKNRVEERKVADVHVQLPRELVEQARSATSWFERLSKTRLVEVADAVTRPDGSDADVVALQPYGTAEVYLPLAGLIDKEARSKELGGKIDKLQQRMASLEKRLSNDRFVQNAPAEVVEKEREKLAAMQQERAGLEQALADLGEVAGG